MWLIICFNIVVTSKSAFLGCFLDYYDLQTFEAMSFIFLIVFFFPFSIVLFFYLFIFFPFQLIYVLHNFFVASLIARLGNRTSLWDFIVAINDLCVHVPSLEFEKLGSSWKSVYGQLNGLIAIGNLSNIVDLDLSFNDISGDIPDVFSQLFELEIFFISIRIF